MDTGRAMIVLAALLAPLPAMAQATITKEEVRAQDPRRTRRQIEQQLTGMFAPPEDMRRKQAPRAPLERLWLNTPAYATGTPGLCRYDSVQLHLAPASDPGRHPHLDASEPMRAYGIDASRQFHFLRPPRESDEEDGDAWPWRGECPRLDTTTTPFFSAPDEEVAKGGYLARAAVIEAVRAGRAVIDKCDRPAGITQSCEALIAGMEGGVPYRIDGCDVDHGAECYEIDQGDLALRVVRVSDAAGYRRSTGKAVEPHAILSVSLDFPIIIADQLID